jgi:hypothetical protein
MIENATKEMVEYTLGPSALSGGFLASEGQNEEGRMWSWCSNSVADLPKTRPSSQRRVVKT